MSIESDLWCLKAAIFKVAWKRLEREGLVDAFLSAQCRRCFREFQADKSSEEATSWVRRWAEKDNRAPELPAENGEGK